MTCIYAHCKRGGACMYPRADGSRCSLIEPGPSPQPEMPESRLGQMCQALGILPLDLGALLVRYDLHIIDAKQMAVLDATGRMKLIRNRSTRPPFTELDALKTIVQLLEPLSHEARVRVLGAALCMLHGDVATAALLHWRASA